MIYTWLADVSALWEEETYRKYYHMVPAHRQEKADRLMRQEDKALSIGAWCLYQQMQKQYGLSEESLFNLSHSGNCVLCSVDDCSDGNHQLGCDLERIRDGKPRVAERFFCRGEYELINGLESQEAKRHMFYRLWVLKESFMKATRLGMGLGMDQFEIGFSREDKPYLKRQPMEFAGEYFFREYPLLEIPYKIAVCSSVGEFSEDIPYLKL